jgi:hypothetical protein
VEKGFQLFLFDGADGNKALAQTATMNDLVLERARQVAGRDHLALNQ